MSIKKCAYSSDYVNITLVKLYICEVMMIKTVTVMMSLVSVSMGAAFDGGRACEAYLDDERFARRCAAQEQCPSVSCIGYTGPGRVPSKYMGYSNDVIFDAYGHLYYCGLEMGPLNSMIDSARYRGNKATRFTQPWLEKLKPAPVDYTGPSLCCGVPLLQTDLNVQTVEGSYTQLVSTFMQAGEKYVAVASGLTGIGAVLDAWSLGLEVDFQDANFWTPIVLNLGRLNCEPMMRAHEDKNSAIKEYYMYQQDYIVSQESFYFTEPMLASVRDLILALITKFIGEHDKEIVLIGQDKWQPFVNMVKSLVKDNFTSEKMLTLFKIKEFEVPVIGVCGTTHSN